MERRRDGMGVASSLALIAAPAVAIVDSAAHAGAPAVLQRPASSTPSALWRDVTGVGVTCLVQTPRGVDTGAIHTRLCEAVRARAAAGAPVPVTVAALGGEALAPGRVTLLVHAAISDVRGAPVLTLTIRPFRNDAAAGQFFGAAPRAVAADDHAGVDAAIRGLLAETLPWHADARPAARPLPK